MYIFIQWLLSSYFVKTGISGSCNCWRLDGNSKLLENCDSTGNFLVAVSLNSECLQLIDCCCLAWELLENCDIFLYEQLENLYSKPCSLSPLPPPSTTFLVLYPLQQLPQVWHLTYTLEMKTGRLDQFFINYYSPSEWFLDLAIWICRATFSVYCLKTKKN